MNSIDQSILLEEETPQQPQRLISQAISEYEGAHDSDNEVDDLHSDLDFNHDGLQNKRTIKIKPLYMFKDLISLEQENQEKQRIVKELQKINEQLRNQYNDCISHNDKLEHFFKEVEFTFQPEKKKVQNSEVMFRAKKNLYQEAKEAKERMKKIHKSSQTSAIQQVKTYIAILETQKAALKDKTQQLQAIVANRIKHEDFNLIQIDKFNTGSHKIRKTFNREFEIAKQRHQNYKEEKMEIKSKVKLRNLETEKKRYKEECEVMKDLLREEEGLEYQIELLKQRVKEKKKENSQFESLKERIIQKESTTMRLQKQLRQKFKTYEYMMEWTKELKKQLEARKSDHIKKKAAFQEQINILTSEYQKFSQLYKAGLFEEQAAKRKGSREMVVSNVSTKPSQVKMINFDEIKYFMKSLSFFLLKSDQQVDQFIDDLLRVKVNRLPQREGRKLKVKATFSLEKQQQQNSRLENITVQDICDSFDFSKSHNLSKEEYTKLAHYIVEDQKGPSSKPTVSIKIARQILKNLLKREIETREDLQEAEQGVGGLLRLHGDSIRPQLKLSAGLQQEIQIPLINQVIMKYGFDPYHANIYAQFVQFYGWKKHRTIGYIKLVDYDQMVFKLTKLSKQADSDRSDSDF